MGLEDGSLGRTLPRGVQIMLCLVSHISWILRWGGGYVQNIYRIYTECTWFWSVFAMWHFQHLAFFFFDVSHILIRLRKTGEGTFTIRGFHKMGFHTGIVKKGTATIKKNYYQKKDYYKKGRLLSKGTTGKRDYYQKKSKGIEKEKLSRNAPFH